MGGLFGYSSVNSIVNLNVPSCRTLCQVTALHFKDKHLLFFHYDTSKGVSCGPKITAFQSMMLLSLGAPLTPWTNDENTFQILLNGQLTCRGILLETLEIPHQSPTGGCRHPHFCSLSETMCFFYSRNEQLCRCENPNKVTTAVLGNFCVKVTYSISIRYYVVAWDLSSLFKRIIYIWEGLLPSHPSHITT